MEWASLRGDAACCEQASTGVIVRASARPLPTTIEEYVLADSQSRKIEIYYKENSRWIYEAFENSDDITLPSLGVSFSLADVYADVEFEAAQK